MEPITIIMLIVAIALLVGSCFIPEKKEEKNDSNVIFEQMAKRELSEEETARIRDTVDMIISEKREEAILKTDDYLSKVANEKIMSVDEYSKQILERLDKNNSDATFLYHMVSDARDELKNEIARAQKEGSHLDEILLRTAQMTGTPAVAEKKEGSSSDNQPRTAIEVLHTAAAANPKNSAMKERLATRVVTPNATVVEKDADNSSGRKGTAEGNKKTENRKKQNSAKPSLRKENVEADKEEKVSGGNEQRDLIKERILQMHQNGKTIREISRELSMGQGEVKLVIDLYGT